MIARFYQQVVFVFAICLLLITLARIIGALSANTMVIDYHENEGVTYVVYVEDLSNRIRVWLAGTRCFKPLPPWAYVSPMNGSPDYGRDYLLQVERIEELIELVDC
jgi:hypothetical protein